MQFDVQAYRKALYDCDLAIVGSPVKASLIYLQNGTILREKIYGIGIKELKKMGYKQIILSDIIDIDTVSKIDHISELSKNYLRIEGTNLCMTAGHEISCYSLVKEQLKDHSKEKAFPIKYFHFGSVYRMPKNTRFPFNYGERKSFLECYCIYKTSEDAYAGIEEGRKWNLYMVKELLHLPGAEVERPHVTNKPISKRSVHIDTITPLGETIITGMTYWHDDVFTKALNVKRRDNLSGKNVYVYSTHFGLSENVLHSYMINCFDGEGFKFFSYLAPFQVSVIDSTPNIDQDERKKFFSIMEKSGFEYEVITTAPKNIGKHCNLSLKKGVPVVVILKSVNGKLNINIVTYNTEQVADFNCIEDIIKKSFIKHDEMVKTRLSGIEKEMTITCSSIAEVVDVVASSKVAKFYCEKSDENAIKVESYLTGGEVLGFAEVSTGQKDIFGNFSNYIAYASRRS